MRLEYDESIIRSIVGIADQLILYKYTNVSIKNQK